VREVYVRPPPEKVKPPKKKKKKKENISLESRSTVVVRLPADARLYVDNVACPLTSAKRSFHTPRLEPGRQYYYTLKAEMTRDGQPVVDSRRVYVSAGKTVNVDFGNMMTVSTAKR
jgi:uncharacterized protein (TIGR03000 family)